MWEKSVLVLNLKSPMFFFKHIKINNIIQLYLQSSSLAQFYIVPQILISEIGLGIFSVAAMIRDIKRIGLFFS